MTRAARAMCVIVLALNVSGFLYFCYGAFIVGGLPFSHRTLEWITLWSGGQTLAAFGMLFHREGISDARTGEIRFAHALAYLFLWPLFIPLSFMLLFALFCYGG